MPGPADKVNPFQRMNMEDDLRYEEDDQSDIDYDTPAFMPEDEAEALETGADDFFETSTGAFVSQLSWHAAMDGRLLVDLPALASGTYRVVVDAANVRTVVPLIVY